MYGPTFPEHLYTVAAQSYGIVDNKSTVGPSRQLLRRPDRVHAALPARASSPSDDLATIMGYEDHITQQTPESALQDRGVLGAHPHLRPHQVAARPSWRRRHRLEVLRREGPLDERAAGDPARPVHARRLGEGPGPRELHRATSRTARLPAVSWLIPPEPYNEHPGDADPNSPRTRRSPCAPARTGP